jgi:hypothetical protein
MRFYLLGIIGVMLLLSACIQQTDNAPVVTEPATQTPAAVLPKNVSLPCANGSILDKDSCFAALANTTGNVSVCDSIYSSDLKDSCIYGFAKNDGTLCDRLFSKDMRAECFLSYARNSGDFKVCDNIGVEATRQACLKELSPPCSFETTDEAKGQCLAFTKKNYTYCRTTDCYIEFARNFSDAGPCDMISDTDMPTKLACRAAARNDSTECKGANNSVLADVCYEMFAKLSGDPGVCAQVSAGSPYRNSCYVYFALTEKNSSYCKNPTPESARDLCYSNYSITLNDWKSCENVVVSINKAKCYIDVAKINGNPAACNDLLFGNLDVCANMVFTGPGVANPAFCADVESTLWRDKCYIWSAEHDMNQTLCNFVSSNDSLAKCMAPFQSG